MMSIRRKGALKAIAGCVGFALAIALAIWLDRHELTNIFVVVPLAAPGALALVGLIELVTNAPFTRLAQSWDALRGWQRGVLGLLICAAVLIAGMGCMILFA